MLLLIFFILGVYLWGLALTENLNVLPNPYSETTLIVPPSYSHILLQIESPTPLLAARYDMPLYTLLNGSNAVLTALGLIPIPLSFTVIWIIDSLWSCVMPENTLITPFSWNLIALLSKFSKTYYTLLLSKYIFVFIFLHKYLTSRFC